MRKQGFILTTQSYDCGDNAHVELWLSCDDGPHCLIVDDQRPNFFVLAKQQHRLKQIFQGLNIDYECKVVALTSFEQQAVVSCSFASLADFYLARRRLKQVHIAIYEDDFRLEQRYMMERFIQGSAEFVGYERSDSNPFVTCTQAKLKPCDYQPKLALMSFDVECSQQGELYSIAIYGQQKNDAQHFIDYAKVFMIGEAQVLEDELDIVWLCDEKQLIKAFIASVAEFAPDILIGWNVVDFDCRLLLQRAAYYDLNLNLGRDGGEVRWRDNPNDKKQGFIHVAGRVVIDGIAALKAATYQFASFSLEAVSQTLLNRGKKTVNVEQRSDEIDYNFQHNKAKLAAYNLEDCILVWEIFRKTNILNYLIFRSQLTGLALDKIGGSVAAFTNLYLPRLHRHGYIAPNLPQGSGLASPGGYVMESRPGLYQNVLVLDFKSLYPSIIRTFKVDPMGLIEGAAQAQNTADDAIDGYIGARFSRTKHILPELIATLGQQRDLAKQAQDLPRAQAIKIIMSSFYGVLGSGGCRFYDTKLASSITLRGHDIMQATAKLIKEQGYEVIYGDTDSTFVLLGEGYTCTQANEIGTQLESLVNQYWQQHLAEKYQLACYLEIEFETHYRRFLMPTIRGLETGSKKRYAGINAKDNTLVFKGLEAVRSDWTALAKDFQTQLYQQIFDDGDPRDLIRLFVQETLAGKRDAQLVYRKRLRRPLQAYQKNKPPHVKAAILADQMNAKLGRPLQYQDRAWVEYVMTLDGPQTLTYQTQGIDYQLYIDRQLKTVADAILPFIGLSFDEIIAWQMDLF